MESKRGYILWHLLWLLITLYWFKATLFRTLPEATYSVSLTFLWVCLILSCVMGIAITLQKDRGIISLVYTLALAYGIYSVVAYFPYFSKLIVVVICVTVIFTVICVVCLFRQQITIKRHKKIILKRRLHRSLLLVRQNLSIGAIGFMLFLCFRLASSGTLLCAEVSPTAEYGEQYNLANNIDTILLLQEDRWKKLTLQEKLNCLQVVANCEAVFLGIGIDINVGTADLEENIQGYYKNSTHQVIIDLEHLENSSARAILNTMCHECYHAYSYQLCELYLSLEEDDQQLLIFDDIGNYVQEFMNYESDDLMAYIGQDCEADAFLYAEGAAEDYYYRIEQYLAEKEENRDE